MNSNVAFQGNVSQENNVPQVYNEIPNNVTLVPIKDQSPSSNVTQSNDADSLAHSLADSNGGLKSYRSNSISSFDALLSAVNDDLVEFRKEKREDEKIDSNHHLAALFGSEGNATANIDLSMLQSHQGGQQMTGQQLMSQTHPFSLPYQQGPNVAMNNKTNDKKKKKAKKQKQAERRSISDTSNCEIEMAIKRLSSHLNDDPFDAEASVEESSHSHRKGLDRFLETYGDDAMKSKDRMLKAIEDSESSLAKIHEWDRSLGLRKCSNRTVVKTRRSRAQLKAFLQGVKPPKEPKARSKKKKSNSYSL